MSWLSALKLLRGARAVKKISVVKNVTGLTRGTALITGAVGAVGGLWLANGGLADTASDALGISNTASSILIICVVALILCYAATKVFGKPNFSSGGSNRSYSTRRRRY